MGKKLQVPNTSLLRLRPKRSYAAGFTTTPLGFARAELSTSAQCPKRRGDYPSPHHLRDGVSRRFQ
ncbi:MAG: hypothetical protein V7L20_12880 [Nostoc sp.]|uniref:hypothetical protein n=1 Tax=Nostoc sp. TaxID=1180 RepID=UPI002FF83A0C